MATPNSVIASALAECDLTGSEQGGTNPELLAWVGEDCAQLMREIDEVDVRRFETLEYKTITTFNFVTVTGLGPHGTIRRVFRKNTDNKYVHLPPADDNFQFDAPHLCWNQGRSSTIGTLNVWPEADALGDYLIWYTAARTAPAANADIDIPPGFEKILAQMLCQHIRRRLDQSTSAHDQAIEDAWKRLKPTLRRATHTPTHVSDFNASDY